MMIEKPGTGSHNLPRAVAILLASVFASVGGQAAAADADLKSSCEAIGSQSMAQAWESAADSPAVVTKASYETEAAESMKMQFMFGKRSVVEGLYVGENVKELPTHCRIEGYFAPAVKFLLLLPDPKEWVGSTLNASCDAFCGAIDEDRPVPGLINGYASIATDGGHINKRPFDGTWGYNNRQGEIDFGYRATHLAAQLAKAVAKSYYGKKAEYSYITGFSKGGLAGIKAALTYPEDFDGVLSRAPVVRYQEINAVRMPWIYKSTTRADGSPILLAPDAMIVHKEILKQCDAVDGLEDGIIDDPRDCKIDTTKLLCEVGETENCLTREQVTAVDKMYELPKNDKGEVVYPYPLEYGSEYDWMGFHAPRKPEDPSYAAVIGRTFLRYMAFEQDPGPGFDWLAFDAKAGAEQLEYMKPVWDATDPDLSAFRDAGGKMIVIHGWGDGAVSARMTIEWYESVKKFMGDSTDDFLKFYLVPGSKHGGSPGDGPNINDSFAALTKWVEKGKAPEKLIFRRETEEGKVIRTRPVFPYPDRAQYKGRGSIDKASSFKRVGPRKIEEHKSGH